MSDITMCLCEECKMKSSCYRARANPDFFYQGYADFTEFCQKDGYKYYIEDRKRSKRLEQYEETDFQRNAKEGEMD